jgi:hypothetical protein
LWGPVNRGFSASDARGKCRKADFPANDLSVHSWEVWRWISHQINHYSCW